MPVKENDCHGAVFIYGSDGTKIPLDGIPVLDPDIVPDEEMQEAIADLSKLDSFGNSMNVTLLSRELLVFVVGMCTLEQLNQNNWRRLHGLPMRRK